MTEKEIQEWKNRIDQMSQMEMAEMLRFSPLGHPVFSIDLPLYEYFMDRFKSLGGMTPEISKRIGW